MATVGQMLGAVLPGATAPKAWAAAWEHPGHTSTACSEGGGSDLGLSSHPGSPSGHAMGAAGVYYIMVTALLSTAMGKKQSRTLKYW